jgi:cyclopropane fatty-acyl-phospholipid synthase-like methyltransferase
MQMQDSHNVKANEWVLSWLRRLTPEARVLDFACGGGRHALAALDLGMDVSAWDRDPEALEAITSLGFDRVRSQLCDLESEPWPEIDRKFDAVVVTNYHELLGRPRRADFLLEPGELFFAAQAMGLHVLSFQDSVVNEDDAGENWAQGTVQRDVRQLCKPVARVQRLAAIKRSQTQATPEALSAWPVNIPG